MLMAYLYNYAVDKNEKIFVESLLTSQKRRYVVKI